ncbi:Protein prenyltransferase alpha subunit repeat-containing protein 1 [Balamuthia mandrillaris]
MEGAFTRKNLALNDGRAAGRGRIELTESEVESAFVYLNSLFQQDPLIDELGFVTDPSAFVKKGNGGGSSTAEESTEKKTPLRIPQDLFYCENHKLGICFDVIPSLYRFAQSILTRTKAEVQRTANSEQEHLAAMRTLLHYSTRTVLLINAENYSAWNVRKELLSEGHLGLLTELQLLNLVFTKHPKSGEAWGHRLWLLQQLLLYWAVHVPSQQNLGGAKEKKEEDQLVTLSLEEKVEDELERCMRVAEIYPKNYHAWSHRTHMIYLLNAAQTRRDLDGDHRMEGWVRRHVSDYCGFHQRQTLLLQLMRLCGFRSESYKREDLFQIAHQHRCSQRRVSVGEEEKEDEGDIADCVLRWRKEFWLCRKLLLLYPGHEALWQHRRFLFWHWHCELKPQVPPHHLCSSSGMTNHAKTEEEEAKKESKEKLGLEDPKTEAAREDELGWPKVEEEMRLAQECMTDADVERFQRQRTLAASYLVWVLETSRQRKKEGVASQHSDKEEKQKKEEKQERRQMELDTLAFLAKNDPIHANLWRAKLALLR